MNVDIELDWRILIAGASSDIGLALVQQLLSKPVRLGLHGYRSLDRLKTFEEENVAADVKIFQKNLDNGGNAIALLHDFIDWAGGIDVLVQLTGDVSSPVSWEEISPEAWEKDLSVNLTASFFLAREAIKAMSGGGHVVLMSNAAAQRAGSAKTIAYGVAKAGIERVVKALAKFSAGHDILVNAVSPGFIDTRFHVERAERSPEELVKRKSLIPLPHVGTVEDVATMILYLISRENRYVTGQCIRIDGGDFL